jgi:homoserine kinase
LLQLLQSKNSFLLKTGAERSVHQPSRQKLEPGLAEALNLEHEDLLGVCLSG